VKRDEMLHVARAAAAVAGVRRVLVVGSQAILGAYDETQLPARAIASTEVDIVVLDDPAGTAGTTVDAAIGFMSMFHTTNGYFADGVELTDLVLPVGGEGRRLHLPTHDADGEPLDVYFVGVSDLLAGKLGAGRPQDRSFAQALARHRLTDGTALVDLEDVRRLAATLDDRIGARTRALALVDVLLQAGPSTIRTRPPDARASTGSRCLVVSAAGGSKADQPSRDDPRPVDGDDVLARFIRE
jgi:hypothetical protein